MLLGRTAGGLYWMNRQIERAENMARLVDAGTRIALTHSADVADDWKSVLESAGCAAGYAERYGEGVEQRSAVDYLMRDTSNSSSVMSCIEAARTNARMVRTALTREAWEAVNDSWMSIRIALAHRISERALPELLDQTKRQTSLIRGAFQSTMIRDEAYDFARLGTFIERADNTARILDVKYYVLLPSVKLVGSALDNYQWESILRSVSGHRAFRSQYGSEVTPKRIADFLILNPRMPRSLLFCCRNIRDNLDYLERDHGIRHSCSDRAYQVRERLESATIDSVLDEGLHSFLLDFIRENNALGADISEQYRFD